MAKRLIYDRENDYYVTLGISPFATPDQLHNAFRQRAKDLHPDRNPDATAKEKFQRLNEAYDTLSNPAMRVQYDLLRGTTHTHSARSRSPQQRRSVWGGLMHSPYRYVLLVALLLAIVNGVFIFATKLNPPLPTANAGPIETLPPLDSDTLANRTVCDAGALIGSPANEAHLTDAFAVSGSTSGAYQLEWSLANLDANTRAQFQWQVLASGQQAITHGMLATIQQTAVLPHDQRVYLRLLVTPPPPEPFQSCQIALVIVSNGVSNGSPR